MRRRSSHVFSEAISAAEHSHDFIVVDTPGSDSYLMRLAHAMADTLVTPLNDSFVDFDVLGIVDPQTFAVIGDSHYAEMVREARRQRRIVDGVSTDWVVLRNRLALTASRNRRTVGDSLKELGLRLGFRLAEGFAERVVYREFFPRGLTAFDDLDEATLGARPSMSHVTARQEVRELHRHLEAADRRARTAARRGARGMVRRGRQAARSPRHPRGMISARTLVAKAELRSPGPTEGPFMLGLLRCRARDTRRSPMAKDRSEGAPAPATRSEPAKSVPRKSSSRVEIDAFVARARTLAPIRRAGQARAADLCARCHHEPAADLGHGLPAAGRHVPRGGGHRRARRAARLLPRPRRMPRLALGVGRERRSANS